MQAVNGKWHATVDRVIVTGQWRTHGWSGQLLWAMHSTYYHAANADHPSLLLDYEALCCCSCRPYFSLLTFIHWLIVLLMKCYIIRIADCRTVTGAMNSYSTSVVLICEHSRHQSYHKPLLTHTHTHIRWGGEAGGGHDPAREKGNQTCSTESLSRKEAKTISDTTAFPGM